MKLSSVAKKECSLLNDDICFHTGKACHVDKKRCELFEAWIIPLKKYNKQITLYYTKYLNGKND